MRQRPSNVEVFTSIGYPPRTLAHDFVSKSLNEQLLCNVSSLLFCNNTRLRMANR